MYILYIVVVLWKLEMPTARGAHSGAPFLMSKIQYSKMVRNENGLKLQKTYIEMRNILVKMLIFCKNWV